MIEHNSPASPFSPLPPVQKTEGNEERDLDREPRPGDPIAVEPNPREDARQRQKSRPDHGPANAVGTLRHPSAKNRRGQHENHADRIQDGSRAHRFDQVEPGRERSEDGPQGGEGGNLAHDVAGLFQVLDREFDHDWRNHSQQQRGHKKDNRRQHQNANHQRRHAFQETGPAGEIGQRRDREGRQARGQEKPSHRAAVREAVGEYPAGIGAKTDAGEHDTDNARPRVERHTDVRCHDSPGDQLNHQDAETGGEGDHAGDSGFVLHAVRAARREARRAMQGLFHARSSRNVLFH